MKLVLEYGNECGSGQERISVGISEGGACDDKSYLELGNEGKIGSDGEGD